MSMFFTISFSQIFFSENHAIGEDDRGGFTAFYQKYRDHFVNEYAATNSVEDIAESFFILCNGKYSKIFST